MREAINQYRGFSKEIYILLFARIINALGFFVFPFLLFFFTNKLGVSSEITGRFLFFVALVHVPGSLLGGKLSDAIGRKKTIIVFTTLGAISYIICGMMGETIMIGYLVIAASFFFSAADPAISAMIMDLTEPDNRQSVISLIYLGLNVGVSLGSIVAGFLFENFTKWLFWGDGLTAIFSIILIGLFIQETLPDHEDIHHIERSNRKDEFSEKGSFLRVVFRRPFLVAFALISIIFSFIYSQTGFLLPDHLNVLFDKQASVYYGFLLSLNGVVVVVLTPFLMVLTKRIKPAVNVALAGLIYAFGFGMLIYAKSISWFFVSVFIWTLGEIIGGVNTGVYIANHAPVTHRARFQSLFTITKESGRGLGPLLIGAYLMTNSVEKAWGIIVFASVIGCIGMLTLHFVETRYKKRKSNKEVVEEIV